MSLNATKIKKKIKNLYLFFSGRVRRSPKQRMKDQLNGSMMEADKDQLITEDNDAAYKKCPGVNNVAYVVSNITAP